MFVSSWIRIAAYLAVGLASARWYLSIDAWVHLGLRDLVKPEHWNLIATSFWAAAIVGEGIGLAMPTLKPTVRRPLLWAGILALVCGAVFWQLRVHDWLGDLRSIDAREPRRLDIESASPFGGMTTVYSEWLADAWKVKPSSVIALTTAVFGATGVAALFGWALLVSPAWVMPFLMMISTGFVVIFFGYVEKATPKMLAMECWYLFATTWALQRRSKVADTLSSACLSAMILMHGSAICWLPGHALYLWWQRGWRDRALGVAAFAVPIIAFLVLVWIQQPIWDNRWGNISSSNQWIKSQCITNCGYDFWSLGHLGDIFNCLAALAGIATLCLPEALVRSRGAFERWLALSSVCWMFLSAVWFPVFGYMPDWDLFASTPFVISALAIVVAMRVMPPRRFNQLALAWIVCTALHTFAFRRIFELPL